MIDYEEALELMCHWLPGSMLPANARTFQGRKVSSGYGPPSHKDTKGPGEFRWVFDPREIIEWCIEQQPEALHDLLRHHAEGRSTRREEERTRNP